jgi:hypothetical protein
VARSGNGTLGYAWCNSYDDRAPLRQRNGASAPVGDGDYYATDAQYISGAGRRGANCADAGGGCRGFAAVKDPVLNIRRNTEQPLWRDGFGGELRLQPVRKIEVGDDDVKEVVGGGGGSDRGRQKLELLKTGRGVCVRICGTLRSCGVVRGFRTTTTSINWRDVMLDLETQL